MYKIYWRGGGVITLITNVNWETLLSWNFMG